MNNINLGTSQSRGYENVNLEVKGTQEFLGKEIPVIYGGFGTNQKVVLAKTIAEIHGMETKHVNELINRNIKRFKVGIGIMDLGVVLNDTELKGLGFTQQALNSYKGLRAKGQGGNIYLLSERGYAKLIKIMDSDLAWDIHDQLMDEYFSMREEKEKQQRMSMEDIIIYQMEQSKLMKQQIDEAKTHALQAKADVVEARAEIQNIRNVVAINTTDWRKDTTIIINKISATLDGDYQFVRNKSYELLEQRAKCKLSVRQTNLKRQMLESGCSKSKVNKVSKLDVIDNDNRLKEIYIAVVKEMAIKYNVA